MKKYVVWSIYSLSGNHIQDRIEAESEDEAMDKADKLSGRMSYKAMEVDEYANGSLPKGSQRSRINIHQYNPE